MKIVVTQNHIDVAKTAQCHPFEVALSEAIAEKRNKFCQGNLVVLPQVLKLKQKELTYSWPTRVITKIYGAGGKHGENDPGHTG